MTKKSDKFSGLFGTDGIRGRANIFPMTPEMALVMGRAAGKLLKENYGKARVVIGKDTRLSCYIFENALIAGLCSMGIDTLMVGPLPTPGVAFITRAYRADAGIVISASHNPFYDNGIKFFDSNGFKLPDSWEKKMEEIIMTNDFQDCLPADADIGKNTKIADADGRYIEFVKATFPRKLSLKKLKIVLDCANGAGYRVAPLVFRELDAQVFCYGTSPNGLNINLDCGSMHLETVRKGILEHKADVGIALDGDADRVVMVDENAQIVDGDTILAICARDMYLNNSLKNNRIVGTVMSNLGFVKAMESLGVEVIRSKVGDRYVIQEMLKHEANLGGEQSGHVIFLDHNTTGDGLVCALQVLRIMIQTDSKLSELASFVQKFPQVSLSVPVSHKPPLETVPNLPELLKEVEAKLGVTGRVVARYSGTEDRFRIMVEGAEYKQISQMAESISCLVKDQIGV